MNTIRLPGGAQAEIDDAGQVSIRQDAEHAVQLQPEQICELVNWLMLHVSFLEAKADEQQQEDLNAENRAYDYEVWSMRGGGW